ncbi:MAG TPA: ABC transporter substrate-binding protein [Actinophytocola sp.]|uniref:peptide ABC transporter substrate-binding protein n=1 Tax=Actinophytocola sp. TaxID=1872138 RepID=UPI002DDCD06A|nr:ABC transporter substrate-binding protein [Actinophytocola sp.]HEV2779162.1 ABC transporter substrate-binding protein [Actinophytocola sp.]
MRRTRWLVGVVVPLSLALAVSGCGSSDEGGGGGGAGGAAEDTGDPNGAISTFGTEPENPLVPGNTNETGGGAIINALFTGLTTYDPVTSESKMSNAESIETKDSKTFTIKLKKGWKFHDGTEVKAKNFVDAWNWTAYSPNGAQTGSFFANIQGYEDVHTEDPDGTDGPQKAPEPTSKTMSGLKIIDDYTFEATTAEPFSVFPLTVGYSAFMPLPDAFFKDQKAFEANPIGNGPFKFVSRVPNQNVKLTRFDEYQGQDKPHFKDLTFTFFEGLEAAYAAVASNELDFLHTVPPSGIAGGKYKTDFPDRNGSQPYQGNQTLAFPLYDPKYKNADLRKAISMAINREEITQKIFEGTRTPADGWVNPAVPGYVKGQCGEFCTYNPTKAKEYLAKSGYTGGIEITSNTDGGHKEWITATCNSIKNAIGLECTFVPVQKFSEIRQKANARQMTQIYRAGWLADYPSIENWLNPLLRTGGSSNDGEYSNKEVDAKLAQADAATSIEEANKLYQEAERLVAQDMPTIPLWNQTSQFVWSDRVDKVRLTGLRELDLSSVIVKK